MNSVTLSRRHLKRRVDDYLWYDQSPPLIRLRKILQDKFIPLGQVAIIGGLLRDFARKGPSGFKSDVDLVIKAPSTDVAALAETLGAVQNRFGGFALVTPSWKIDFWALRNTWAHTAGFVNVRSLTDLTKCTFFTTDAIIYNINRREIFASEVYLHGILRRQIEINLLDNPSPDGNMVRAVRRTLAWNMRAGPKLKTFFSELLDQMMFNHIIETENRLYGNSYAEKYDNVDDLLIALCYPDSRLNSEHGRATQYSLPL